MARQPRSMATLIERGCQLFLQYDCLQATFRTSLQRNVGKSGRAAIFADVPLQTLMIAYHKHFEDYLTQRQIGFSSPRLHSTDIYDAKLQMEEGKVKAGYACWQK